MLWDRLCSHYSYVAPVVRRRVAEVEGKFLAELPQVEAEALALTPGAPLEVLVTADGVPDVEFKPARLHAGYVAPGVAAAGNSCAG